MIVFILDSEQGFTAGDTETTRTAYAYPTSPHATLARTMPDRIAAEMVKGANAERVPERIRHDYDSRNWQRLWFGSAASNPKARATNREDAPTLR